jgi:hypothetical protein
VLECAAMLLLVAGVVSCSSAHRVQPQLQPA